MYSRVLTPVDRTPFGLLSAEMREGCRRVFDRTGVRAFFDRLRQCVVFGYGDTSSRVDLLDISTPIKRRSGASAGFDPHLDRFTVDDVCRLVWLSRIPDSVKERWRKGHEVEKKYREDQAKEAYAEERVKPTLDRMAFDAEKLHQGRHYRRSVTV
jgi:hypothetical protein